MKYIKISFLSLLLMALVSCDETLTIPPNTSLIADTAFQDEEDLQLGLNTAYARLDRFNHIRFNSVFSDETKIGGDSGGQEFAFHSFVLNANSGVPSFLWTNRYTVINTVTRVIEASETVVAEDAVARDHILAQCYALRAMAHFELFQYFSTSYTDDNALSVPAVNQVITTEDLPRNNVGEVISLINSDLATAESLIDGTQTDVNFITVDAITALRAKIALFRGDFSTAQSLSQSLLAKYPIANKDQYRDMFFDDADLTEIIFQAGVIVGGQRIGGIWVFTNSAGPFLETSNSLVGAVESQEDVRLETIIDLSRVDTEGFQVVNKYPGVAEPFLNNVKIFRSAEMLLIAAESAVRQNNLSLAEELLNQLRVARIGAGAEISLSSQDAAITAIMQERRVELAFEGHRFLDLKRLGMPIVRDESDCAGLANACTLAATDHRFSLPIPIGEIAANDLIVQNPGY